MNLSRVDLNLLVTFEAIYRTRGITTAAQQLNLTQPAISHALARLRTTLDDPLFERHGNLMVPTARAHSLIGPVTEALGILGGSLQGTEIFDPGNLSRRFVIGVGLIQELRLLGSFFSSVTREAPGVDLVTTRVNRQSLEHSLLAGRLDVAIEWTVPCSDAVHHQVLYRSPLMVAARRDHPAINKHFDLDIYARLEHVAVSRRAQGALREDVALMRANLSRRVRLRCQNLLTASQVVRNSDMLLTVDRFAAGVLDADPNLQLIAFPVDVDESAVHLYWLTKGEADPALCWLRARLRDCMAPIIEADTLRTIHHRP